MAKDNLTPDELVEAAATPAPPAETPTFFVAKEDLWVGSQRAHSVGEQVPAVNVEKFGWHDKVQKPQ